MSRRVEALTVHDADASADSELSLRMRDAMLTDLAFIFGGYPDVKTCAARAFRPGRLC